MNPLQKAILRTLIFFDIFDYPLTLVELWKWLYIADDADRSQTGRRQILDIEEAIGLMPDKVQLKNGFYFLKGREGIIQTRLSRYNISEEKFKRAIKFIRILRFIPFIKCLFVCNRLGYSNVHADSDIDIAVVAQKNRLWLARLFAVGLLSVMKVRLGQIARGRAIDISLFFSEDNLNLESLKFNHDLIFPYWVSQFIPVYDQGIFAEFIKANQRLNKYLPQAFFYQLNARRQVGSGGLVKFVKWLLGLLADWDFGERLAKSYQLKIMPQDLKNLMNNDSRVVINNQVLRLHRYDSWSEVQRKFDRLISLMS